jgi:hypothetical protein
MAKPDSPPHVIAFGQMIAGVLEHAGIKPAAFGRYRTVKRDGTGFMVRSMTDNSALTVEVMFPPLAARNEQVELAILKLCVEPIRAFLACVMPPRDAQALVRLRDRGRFMPRAVVVSMPSARRVARLTKIYVDRFGGK